MRLNDDRRSENVDDRRGIRPAGIGIIAGIGAAIFAAVAMFRGTEPRPLVDVPQATSPVAAQPVGPRADLQQDQLKDFASAILGDTETVWTELFQKLNREYRKPRLVLFTDQAQTACGMARATLGPSYCAGDEKVYIDLSFFQEMNDRYHAPGDFARAYVIAHEVGHHAQNLLGTSKAVRDRQQGLSRDEAKDLSVRLELQADFLAGVWAHHADKARHILEPGDLEAGLKAVAALGDDRKDLDPNKDDDAKSSLTRCWHGGHGTAEQRARWFTRGFKTGDLSQGERVL
jgi:predicted metalloprotease